jgi:outer membrane receptor for ferrienterochelin and colicin
MPWERGSLRWSIGRGKRAANIFAENQQLFATSRQIRILGANGNIFGLDPEDAWNYGASFLQGFNMFGRAGNVTVDYYVTNFKNQVVVDWENPSEVSFYNLEGKSIANSFQFEINYNILKNVELRTAYKFYDVETDYISGSLQKPLQAQHRFFANLGYNTVPKDNGSQWRMDYTLHTLGKQRLPNTASSPVMYQLGEYSPSYSLMNAQVTKVFNSNFEIYVGGENLTNFTQDNPVVGAENPFGTNFDTTMVYGPIMGRMFYTGFRYKL